jgi:hypothetical protein
MHRLADFLLYMWRHRGHTLLHLEKLQRLPEMIERSMSVYIQTPSLLAQALKEGDDGTFAGCAGIIGK